MKRKTCETCKKQFEIKPYRKKVARFCSYKCYWSFTKSQVPPSHLTCTKCRATKEFKFFNKSVAGKYGRKSYCSSCSSKMFKKWRIDNYKQNNASRKEQYLKEKRDYKFYFKRLKSRAIQSDIPFDLKPEFFLSLWNERCHYCGGEVNTAGIDRVDSSKGYIIDNCVRCCSICNKAKNNLSVEDFLSHCKKIVNFNNL